MAVAQNVAVSVICVPLLGNRVHCLDQLLVLVVLVCFVGVAVGVLQHADHSYPVPAATAAVAAVAVAAPGRAYPWPLHPLSWPRMPVSQPQCPMSHPATAVMVCSVVPPQWRHPQLAHSAPDAWPCAPSVSGRDQCRRVCT